MWRGRRTRVQTLVDSLRWRLQINLHDRIHPDFWVARHTTTKVVHTSNEYLKKKTRLLLLPPANNFPHTANTSRLPSTN